MNTSQNLDVGERRAQAETGVSLRGAYLGVFVFFLLGGILNGRHLHEAASRREYGAVRDAWMAVLEPLRFASTTLRADRLRDSLETLRKE